MKSSATLNPVPFELLAITRHVHTACTSEARGKAWPDRKLGVKGLRNAREMPRDITVYFEVETDGTIRSEDTEWS